MTRDEVVARDVEFTYERTVSSVEEDDVVDVKEDSEDVREIGSPSAPDPRARPSADCFDFMEDLGVARGEEGSGRRAYVSARGSMSIPAELRDVRGEL